MKTKIRDKDIFNSSDNLEDLVKIPNFPVFMGTVDHSYKEDIFEDMIWQIGKDTGMIQLKKLIPLEVLYKLNHSSGEVGKLWDLHHEKFAKFISKFSPNKVFEIGGAHGILAKKYEAIDAKIDWTIIEPNPIPVKDSKAKFIKNFFDENFDYNYKNTTIIHSHTLEHVYDPNIFLKTINKILSKDEFHIFSVPNMNEMIKRKYTNALNFEHTYFLTEQFLDDYLENNNFDIIDKEYFLDDHSIFICTKKKENFANSQILKKNYYSENKKKFLEFQKYYKNLINDINKKINEEKENIYLFGAHIFSQYLITLGLNQKKIKYILDNDVKKQKKRLYGSNLIVEDPSILNKESCPLVILRAGVYTDEIKKQISDEINKNCRYI